MTPGSKHAQAVNKYPGGRGWTELAKETPRIRTFLAPTTAHPLQYLPLNSQPRSDTRCEPLLFGRCSGRILQADQVLDGSNQQSVACDGRSCHDGFVQFIAGEFFELLAC